MELSGDGFRHVSNMALRRVVERDHTQSEAAWVRAAVDITRLALGEDVIDDTVPAAALNYRIEIAREARNAISSGNVQKAHSALRLFWGS